MTFMNNQFDIFILFTYDFADKILAIIRYNYDLYFILQSLK